MTTHSRLSVPGEEEFLQDVLDGLSESQKTLPSKYLYDERGSELFEAICEVDEYYQTRTELAIMQHNIGEICTLAGRNCLLVEYGSGSSLKTRELLTHLPRLAGYVPIEISETMLQQTSERLQREYPQLPIHPICADYLESITLPSGLDTFKNRLVYFPGSTIGNFHPDDALAFIRRMAKLAGDQGAILMGVDVKKDVDILEPAYNDAAGVTAEFNLNLLDRMNRELDADFERGAFRHEAVYNADKGRIEMHIVSRENQTVTLAGEYQVDFDANESIRTECSYKYHIDEFHELARRAGTTPTRTWTDRGALFSVHYLKVNA